MLHAAIMVSAGQRYVRMLVHQDAPCQDSRVLLVSVGLEVEAFLGLSKHEKLQHFSAVGADIKGRNYIKLGCSHIM